MISKPTTLLRNARQGLPIFVVSLIWIVCVSARAQTASLPATGPYRIAGRVVNATTGEAVRKATVTALAEEDSHIVASVQADADGQFHMDHMPAGKFPLTASKRGFRTAFYDEHDDFNSAIVTGADQDTSHLVFQLVPGAVLHGVVTGDGGDRIESANVLLFQRQGDGARGDQIRQMEGTMTDDTGAYEFGNLAPGVYMVAVTAAPWYAMHPSAISGRSTINDVSSPLDVAYPVTFFDSTTEEASASPVVLAPGGREQADINLHAVPALRLQVSAPRKGNGIVQPELRQMIFGMQVSAESAGTFDSQQSGMVSFNGIAPGHYELAQGDPLRVVELDAATSQEVEPNIGTPAMNLTGTLSSAGGALPESVVLMLEPVGGHGRAGMQVNAHRGQFQFDAVAPGTWNIVAANQGQALQIVSVSTGGSTVAGSQFTMKDRALAIVATVSVTLTRVQGFARKDGKGMAGVMIVLVPRQPSAYEALVRRDQSDSDGSFSLRDVPPGQYTVIAIEDGWKLDWNRRETILRYLPHGVAVTVSDRSGTPIHLSDPVPVQPR
ncbi:MAG TPA: carboxypeptidase-like regulatory domain-containing protein [Terracidiphilus sp.]